MINKGLKVFLTNMVGRDAPLDQNLAELDESYEMLKLRLMVFSKM